MTFPSSFSLEIGSFPCAPPPLPHPYFLGSGLPVACSVTADRVAALALPRDRRSLCWNLPSALPEFLTHHRNSEAPGAVPPQVSPAHKYIIRHTRHGGWPSASNQVTGEDLMGLWCFIWTRPRRLPDCDWLPALSGPAGLIPSRVCPPCALAGVL